MTFVAAGCRLLPALIALALGASAALAQERIGVTSAVNPDAAGTPPGLPTRQLVLGQDVIHNERVTTTTAGQAQVQFIDASAMTVAPNSDVTIDDFIFDPNTGKGRLAMSATAGIFRFVGGKVSKNEGAVVLRTPSASIGIRGGVFLANIERNGQLQVIFLYGQELTVTGGNTSRSVARPGFQITVAGPGSAPSYPTPVPDRQLAGLLGQLEGRAGASGGAHRVPTDLVIADSGVPATVSDNVTGSIQAAALNLPPPTKPTQIDVANQQTAYQVNQVQGQQAVLSALPVAQQQEQTAPPSSTPPSPPPNAVTNSISGNAVVSSETRFSAAANVGIAGTLRFPDSTLQNGMLTVTASDLRNANPGISFGSRDPNITINSFGGSATLSPLTAGATNIPVTLSVAGTLNGSSSLNGISLSGTLATGTAAVTPDGQFFTANLTIDNPLIQQFDPADFGASISTFGGVPTVTMPTTGVGTYSGTATGAIDKVSNTVRTATGSFSQTYNFGSQTGTVAINNFDGANYQATIAGTGNAFSGQLIGTQNRNGSLSGNFFGSQAVGVGGKFDISSFTNNVFFPILTYHAAGVFAGSR